MIVRVRILFTFAGGTGHADPLVPIADAAQASGHAVAFAGRASAVADLEAQGFTVYAEPGTAAASTPPTIAPLVEVSMEREERVLREYYAGRLARARAESVRAVCAEWAPDAIVCDEADFGSMVAAERLDLPHATVLVIAAGSFVRSDVVAEPLDALRAEHGLPPDPDLTMPSRHLVLSPFPPSFRDPAFPLPATAHSIRPASFEPRLGDTTPGWLSTLRSVPTIYFTLGTVFNLESGDLFERVISGMRELPMNVIVTVGPQLEPRKFGPQPSNVRIERVIPHAVLLPHCDLVVGHGGSGSVIGALVAGLPSVVIPMGADQPLNAARCEALGVGVALDALSCTPESVREAVLAVLSEPSYRDAAERIRDEIAALPGPAHAVTLLERLATESA
jgi:UDP:flavonoid glycosyltransferase YjiC (YdhE family)